MQSKKPSTKLWHASFKVVALLLVALPVLGATLTTSRGGSSSTMPVSVALNTAAVGEVLAISDVSPRVTDKAVPTSGSVFFVSTAGSDANPGTESQPKRTIAAAISASSSGATIVIRSGVYNEQLGTIGKSLVIQSYPGEEVWMDGAAVVPSNEWVVDGAGWRKDGWTTTISQSCYDAALIGPGTLPHYPEMVFFDGEPLDQVSTLGELSAGEFYVDTGASAVYIGSNPSGHTVEVTRYATAMTLMHVNPSFSAAGSEIHGIGFRRYASHQRPGSGCNSPAQVVLNGNSIANALNITMRDVTFYYGSGAGLTALNMAGLTVESSSFIENGFNGLQADRVDGLTVRDSIISGNNREGFLISTLDGGVSAQVAGSKMTRVVNGTIDSNQITGNNGAGFWCDLVCDSFTIIRNQVTGNADDGIFYEISHDATIASNVVANNASNGISVKAEDVRIFNNTLYRNNQQLSILEDGREGGEATYPTTLSIDVKNNVLVDATAAKTNEFGAAARMLNIRADHPDDSVARDPDVMLTGLDYNYYARVTSSPASLIGWQGSTVGSANAYSSLSSFVAAHSAYEQHGLAEDGVTVGSVFRAAGSGDYRLAASSSALNAGLPLTTDEASLLGIAQNSYVDMGALVAVGMTFSPTAPVTPSPTPPPPPPPAGTTPQPVTETPATPAPAEVTESITITPPATDNNDQTPDETIIAVSDKVCAEYVKIEYFIASKLVGQGCEFKLDTGSMANGDYVMVVRMTDAEGKVFETTKTITVNNATAADQQNSDGTASALSTPVVAGSVAGVIAVAGAATAVLIRTGHANGFVAGFWRSYSRLRALLRR